MLPVVLILVRLFTGC